MTYIRPAFGAIALTLQTAEGSPATAGANDYILVEAGSVSYSAPFVEDNANEMTGSYVAGAPEVRGQAVEVSFRARVRGAGVPYSASVKPPIAASLNACGYRGRFVAAVTAEDAPAGSTGDVVQLPGLFGLTGTELVGCPVTVDGATTFAIASESDDEVTVTDTVAVTIGDQIAVPAHWSFAATSPSAASVDVDHPCATIDLYEDGTRVRVTDARGRVEWSVDAAGSLIAAFTFSGSFDGKTDVAVPDMSGVPSHPAPKFKQGGAALPAFAVGTMPLAISTLTISDATELSSPADPNTKHGFGAGIIGRRTPVLTCDPLATLVGNRNTLAAIETGARYPIAVRVTGVAGNNVAFVIPSAQPTAADAGERDTLRTENMSYRVLNGGRDSVNRDTDKFVVFY